MTDPPTVARTEVGQGIGVHASYLCPPLKVLISIIIAGLMCLFYTYDFRYSTNQTNKSDKMDNTSLPHGSCAPLPGVLEGARIGGLGCTEGGQVGLCCGDQQAAVEGLWYSGEQQ